MKNIIIFAALGAMFFSSCDGLLPRKITDGEAEETEETTLTDEEFYSEDYGNDVSTMYAEHDPGLMAVYEFYSEYCFGNGNYNTDRFLSKRLKRALKGILSLEEKTGYVILDCDPFIDAQDVVFGEDDYSVERVGGSDWFEFSYDNTSVRLLVKEEDGEYVIDDVLLSSGKTLVELYDEEKLSNL